MQDLTYKTFWEIDSINWLMSEDNKKEKRKLLQLLDNWPKRDSDSQW